MTSSALLLCLAVVLSWEARPAAATSWDALREYVCAQQCPSGVRDVAVVGGGASGLYSAWRIKGALPETSVAVLESSERIGGRLYSIKMPGMPHLPADLGGMHYVADPKNFLNAWLVDETFKLPSREFYGNMSDPNVLLMLRNVRFRLQDLKNASFVSQVYHLTQEEVAVYKDPPSLRDHFFRQLLPDYDDRNFDPWKARTVFNRSLFDMSVAELLRVANASEEATHLIADAHGYSGKVKSDQGAATYATLFKDYVEEKFTYRAPEEGMEALVWELERRFRDMGGTVDVGHQVRTVVQCDPMRYGLVIELVPPQQGVTEKIVCSRNVILAVTQNALEHINWQPLLQKKPWTQVCWLTASKLFLGFDRPWWRDLSYRLGSTATTLDLEHLYYLGSEEDFNNSRSVGASRVGRNQNALLLASYATEDNTYLWKYLSANNTDQVPFKGNFNPFVNKSEPIVPQGGRVVSNEMVQIAMKQLALWHNVALSDIPQPYTAATQVWPVSWHRWRAGANATDLIDMIARLDPTQDVFIVGEAYSKNDQGWVEGALRSAEYVLQTHFKLKPLPGMPVEWMKNYAAQHRPK